MVIKVVFLVAFFAVMLTVGFVCRKKADSVQGFVLGGRSVGPWLTAFAYGTSYFSAVIFVGYAGQFGWKFGVAATWIGIGNALIGSLLAWVLLGRRTRLMTQHLEAATMPEFFGKRFGRDSLKIAASVIVFIFLIPYTASLYNGLSRLFESAFGIDYIWCVILMSILTGIYVIAGGYMATAVNDFIQGIIMLFGIVVVVVAVLKQNGGFASSLQLLSQVESEAVPALSGAFTSFFGPEPLSLLGVILLTSLGTWGLPQMIGKFYAIRNESAISKGTLISTLFAFVVAGGCYFMGGFGRLYGDQIAFNGGKPVFDSIVPTMLEGLPDVVVAIVIMLVLSASMSTLSSLVLTSSSTLALDMILPLRKKKTENKGQMLLIRVLIVFFIVVSAALAIVQTRSSVTFIAQLMGISWGALAGAFLAPFLYSLYWKKVTRAAVWVSFISGVGIMVANMICTFAGVTFITPSLSSPIQAGVLAMVVGLVLVPVVSLLTRRGIPENTDGMFSCYDRTITVHATTSLDEK